MENGANYVLSIYEPNSPTNYAPKVFTHEGSDIYLRPYRPGDQQQIFRCTVDPNNRWGFVCVGSGVRMNRNSRENLKCNASASTQGSWECFYFNVSPNGGYQMLMTKDERLCPLEVTSDSGGEFLAMRAESNARVGVTRVGTEKERYKHEDL